MTTSPDWKGRYTHAVASISGEITRLRAVAAGDADAKVFLRPVIDYLQALKKTIAAGPIADPGADKAG